MDLFSNCEVKLLKFRVKELKDVLTLLGLSKQGKKADLVNRILHIINQEQVPISHGQQKKRSIDKVAVANIIDDVHRKMLSPGAAEVVLNIKSNSNLDLEKPKAEVRVCCPCGNTLVTDSMIMCENPCCQVWQHIACVLIPEKPMEQPETPSCFYCELCRISKADPFWVTLQLPLHPLKLTPSRLASDGAQHIQIAERVFTLSKLDIELLQKTEVDLQVWCLLFNDKVPFRMQWPQHVDVLVNGIAVRVINRPGSQLLGINGRDDGCLITAYSREGINKISISMLDARMFCLGIRLAKRRTVEQVLDLIPKEGNGEKFEAALARVCRCIGGDATRENADGDSDLEVVAESVSVNLRCPMSGLRIRVAGRFKPCIHMGCFDLETFVKLNQRSRKWQCPICLKNYALENIIIDPYFNRITSLLQSCGDDVNEIEVKPNGSWRMKNGGKCSNLSRWHYADGSLYVATKAEIKPDTENTKPVIQESGYENSIGLKIGIKRNRDGKWVDKKSEDKMLAVNQDGGTHFGIASNSLTEVDSLPSIFDIASKDSDIINLSDSEENNGTNQTETNQADGNRTSLIDISDIDFDIPIWNDNLMGMPNSNPELNGSFVGNPLAIDRDDPLFILSTSASDSMQSDLRGNSERASGAQSDDLIALAIAAAAGHRNSALGLPITALGATMKDNEANKATCNGHKADSSRLHPMQPHTSNPPVILSIDTDSE